MPAVTFIMYNVMNHFLNNFYCADLTWLSLTSCQISTNSHPHVFFLATETVSQDKDTSKHLVVSFLREDFYFLKLKMNSRNGIFFT